MNKNLFELGSIPSGRNKVILEELHKKWRLLQEEESRNNEVIRNKTGLVMAMLISFRKVYQVDCLTSADMVMPDGFKIPISGRAKTGIKSWFGDQGLSISDSILRQLSFFWTVVMNLLMIWLTSDRHSWISVLLFDQYAIHGIPDHMVPMPHSFDLTSFHYDYTHLFSACMCFNGKMNQHCGPLPVNWQLLPVFSLPLTLQIIVFKDPAVNSAFETQSSQSFREIKLKYGCTLLLIHLVSDIFFAAYVSMWL